MIKSREYARVKVGRMPEVVCMSDGELSKLHQDVAIEAEDIANFLEGNDLGLLDDFADIDDCPIEVLLQGLKMCYDTARENGGQSEEILAYQRNIDGFDPDSNPLSRLVAGQKIDFRQVKSMDEKTIREWIKNYLETLRNEQHH